MKVYHVTSLVECSLGHTDRYTGEQIRSHHDLGLHTTWKGAMDALLAPHDRGGLVRAWKGPCVDGYNGRAVVNEAGRVWVDADGQATRLTLSCPNTTSQWFIEQREVKA